MPPNANINAVRRSNRLASKATVSTQDIDNDDTNTNFCRANTKIANFETIGRCKADKCTYHESPINRHYEK